MQPNSKFSKIIIKAMLIMLFALLLFLFVKSLSNMSNFAVHFNQSVHYRTLILVFLSIILMFVIFAIFKLINRCNKKVLTIITISIFSFIVIIQALIAFKFDFNFITDTAMINDQSLAIAKGIKNGIDTDIGYFHYISNNNFIVLFLALVYKVLLFFGISDFTSVLAFFNAILIDVAIFIVYKTIELCFNKTTATKYMVLTILNPMNYFIIYWVYTATFSMPLLALAVYLSISVWKSSEDKGIKNYIKIALIAITGVVGFYLRPIVLIPLIAAGICFILFVKINKTNIKRIGISLLVLIIVGVISYAGLHKTIYNFVPDTSAYFPVSHYVTLGLSNNGRYSDDVVENSAKHKTTDKINKYNINQSKKLLKKLGFVGVSQLYLSKADLTWAMDSDAYVGVTRQVENGGTIYNYLFGDKSDFIMVYCQIFRILTLLFAAIFVVIQFIRKKIDYCILVSITMLGAIVFYMIWEAKSTYSIPFIPLLLIMACLGIENTSVFLKKKIQPVSKTVLIPFLCVLEIITITIGCVYYQDFTQKKYLLYDRTLFEFLHVWNYDLTDVASKDKVIKQDFYAKTHFNTIELTAFRSSPQNYKYDVYLESNGKTLSKNTIDATLVRGENGILSFPVPPQTPKKLQKYTVVIKPQTKHDGLKFTIERYDALEKYHGDLYINKTKTNGNLALKVFNASYPPLYNPVLYWLAILLLMAAEFASIFIIIKYNKEEQTKNDIE